MKQIKLVYVLVLFAVAAIAAVLIALQPVINQLLNDGSGYVIR